MFFYITEVDYHFDRQDKNYLKLKGTTKSKFTKQVKVLYMNSKFKIFVYLRLQITFEELVSNHKVPWELAVGSSN
jgi:hypothetical protein